MKFMLMKHEDLAGRKPILAQTECRMLNPGDGPALCRSAYEPGC
jgi:hypothetical protein